MEALDLRQVLGRQGESDSEALERVKNRSSAGRDPLRSGWVLLLLSRRVSGATFLRVSLTLREVAKIQIRSIAHTSSFLQLSLAFRRMNGNIEHLNRPLQQIKPKTSTGKQTISLKYSNHRLATYLHSNPNLTSPS